MPAPKASEKWERREAKRRKQQSGMRVRGRSIFTLQEIARRRAQRIKREKEVAAQRERQD